ncbi:MAG: hypothetical protein N4Q32_00620 [Neisseriaceae bacterium]|nr:hypothetical protein [Neisseriaceae bacterium]MCV2508930.1 hypothetical protein [Neisseriaceae bacterium]
MALVSANNHEIVCAIQNEHDFSKDILSEGKKNIAKAFMSLFNLQVTWEKWTENLKTYAELKQVYDLEMQRKGLEYLNSDKIASKLKELFKGEWDATSIRFKDIESTKE